MKVLLVEDHKHMAYAIEQILKKNKYIVDITFDGRSGLEFALENEYDVIILDVMLPFLDGFEVLKELRKEKKEVPVLMLTAKSEVVDKVKGLDWGADDYLPKPFEIDELLARIRSITRRQGTIKDANLKYSNIEIDKNDMKLICENKKIDLTLKEYQLLEMFMQKPNIAISKDTIINKIWSYDKVVIDNNIEVYISFLRKKLSSFDTSVKIKTIRGLGYKITGDDNV